MKDNLFKGAVRAVLISAVTATTTIASVNATEQTSHTTATELLWGPSGFGPQISLVNGHPSEGKHVTYVKFTAGMKTELHTHSVDYVGIVISGVTMHWEPGKPDTKKQLSAGAHWFVPSDVPHVSECLPGAECIMAIYQQDTMDFVPITK